MKEELVMNLAETAALVSGLVSVAIFVDGARTALTKRRIRRKLTRSKDTPAPHTDVQCDSRPVHDANEWTEIAPGAFTRPAIDEACACEITVLANRGCQCKK
jgi:hypothetical protein